ncbi:MAG TPA: exodeoxyribonuclease III [Kofleriaceae bacterium]|nr:exodeoxyribonuclease III [Kofleriaceae bacterium]
MLKIATWNVNSIRARHDRVVAWLAAEQPDVLCMQEIKVEDAGFPRDSIEAAGYQCVLVGQRTYNGVAIASKLPLTDVTIGLDDGVDDDEKRFIIASVGDVRVASIYVPNGGGGAERFEYKLEWLARLRRWLDTHADPSKPLALCGDFNVAPEDRDIHDPKKWEGAVLCTPEERAALANVRAWGFEDVFRKHHSEPGFFSWWDYRGVSFFKDQGLRIDHVWATPALASRSIDCTIDRAARKGQNASDHAPVTATFA